MVTKIPKNWICPKRRSQLAAISGRGGFSLVELVIVIIITGIIASTIGLFIAGPIQAYLDQARRGGMVDAAQLALLRMDRDLRAALPNSVRTSGGSIELLLTLDGDRYRTEPAGAAADRLEFTTADTSFNTFAPLDAGLASPGAALRLAIYPLGPSVPGADPYANDVMTPTSVAVNVAAGTSTAGGGTEYRVSMTPGHRFLFPSPSQRVFLVDGPVSYRCAGRELLRYSGYTVTAAQVPAPTGGTIVTIAKDVESCAFGYAGGTAQRNAVATLAVTIESRSERIRLRRQVQVDNSP